VTCGCGHVLITGYQPDSFLAIRIRCFRCGDITTTPGPPFGYVLPREARVPALADEPVVTPIDLATDVVLADADVARTRPNVVRYESMTLSRSTLDALVAAYDELGGQGEHPFVASLARLREQMGREGWRWSKEDDDVVAAMHVAAFDHLRHCWGNHPDLARLAAGFRVPGRYLRTLTAFGAGKLLFDAGNRIGFALQPPVQELSLRVTMGDQQLGVALSAPDALQWAARDRRSPQVLQRAVTDALASARGQVNRARPGLLMLSASILYQDFDQMLIDAIHATFRAVGRKHGSVAAVVVLMPKVFTTRQADEVGFAYALYPLVNSHFEGENPIRLK
jgi:hypothetical protein